MLKGGYLEFDCGCNKKSYLFRLVTFENGTKHVNVKCLSCFKNKYISSEYMHLCTVKAKTKKKTRLDELLKYRIENTNIQTKEFICIHDPKYYTYTLVVFKNYTEHVKAKCNKCNKSKSVDKNIHLSFCQDKVLSKNAKKIPIDKLVKEINKGH